MTTHPWIYGAVAVAALVAAVASKGLFSETPDPVATSYTPSADFEYYPAQFTNRAAQASAHVENF